MAGGANHSVATRATKQETGYRHGDGEISPLHWHGLFACAPDGMLRSEKQSQECLARPVLGAVAGIGLQHWQEFAVPAAREDTVAKCVALDEVPQNAACDAARLAGGERRGVKQRASPKRSDSR